MRYRVDATLALCKPQKKYVEELVLKCFLMTPNRKGRLLILVAIY
jgi:hypothetical protein